MKSIEQALPPFRLGLLHGHGFRGRNAGYCLYVVVVDDDGIDGDWFHGGRVNKGYTLASEAEA